MDRIIREIYSHPNKRIALDELKKIITCKNYAELAATVNSLTERQVLKPVISSGKNGLDPGLYLKYHIINRPEPDKRLLDEIDSLHHLIDTGVFKRNIEKYILNREFILTLSEFLKYHGRELEYPLSENERAYQIWSSEKALDKKDGRDNISLLKSCGVFERLNTYPAPEPFFDYRKSGEISNVLVIENKDTWFTVRKLMLDIPELSGLFGLKIDCIIYGEGRKVTQKNHSLQDYLNIDSPFAGKVWYWGDIDYEGIDIYLSFAGISDKIDVSPFTAAYRKMCELFELLLEGKDSERLKGHTEQRIPKSISDFYRKTDSLTAEKIDDLLNNGYYIPQEILNYAVLRDNVYFEEKK